MSAQTERHAGALAWRRLAAVGRALARGLRWLARGRQRRLAAELARDDGRVKPLWRI